MFHPRIVLIEMRAAILDMHVGREDVNQVVNSDSPEPHTPAWANHRNFGGIRNGLGFDADSLDRSFRSLSHQRSGVDSCHFRNHVEAQAPEHHNVAVVEEEQSLEGLGISIPNDPDLHMSTPVPSRRSSMVYPRRTDGPTRTIPQQASDQAADLIRQAHTSVGSFTSTYPGNVPVESLNNQPSAIPGANRQSSIYSLLNHDVELPPNCSRNGISAQVSVSPSLMSTDTSTTLTAFTVHEQQYESLSKVYHICLDASTSYIRMLHRRPRSHSRRYSPYAAPKTSRLYNESGSKSLMDNIATISSWLWRKARRDGMAPHRAEGEAIQDMSGLYACGEAVARGLEKIAGDEMEDEEKWLGEKAAEMGMELCERLGDANAWALCESIGTNLQALGQASADGYGEIS